MIGNSTLGMFNVAPCSDNPSFTLVYFLIFCLRHFSRKLFLLIQIIVLFADPSRRFCCLSPKSHDEVFVVTVNCSRAGSQWSFTLSIVHKICLRSYF